MAKTDALVSFHMQRILCGLANAKSADIRKYNETYKLNNNPVLTSLTVQTSDGSPSELPATRIAGAPIPVASGKTLSLAANWSPDSVESYPAYDVVNLVLSQHWEAMRVAWYATGGSFEHDVTGRGESENTTTYAENSWKPDGPGPVHMWIVLNDIRGGTDFASYDIKVTP